MEILDLPGIFQQVFAVLWSQGVYSNMYMMGGGGGGGLGPDIVCDTPKK